MINVYDKLASKNPPYFAIIGGTDFISIEVSHIITEVTTQLLE